MRCLDHNDLNNYRPVTNLCFIAEILVKLVLSHNPYNTIQSACRPDHSNETDLLRVVDNLFRSLNKGNMSAIVLLYFSSAFDKIGHSIIVHRRHTEFGVTDTVLQWFLSYLTVQHSISHYLINYLLLHLYTQVFLRLQFMDLYFSPCILSLFLQLLSKTLSYILHLLMTYNYRCLLTLTKLSELLHSMQSCMCDVKALAAANILELNDN